MNPDESGPTTFPRIIAALEIIFGLLVPLLIVGPFLVFGLIFGIVSPFVLFISVGGAWGLAGVAILLSSSDKISRQRAQFASAGVIAGTLLVLYLFIDISTSSIGRKQAWHWDEQSVVAFAVLTGPAIVGLRRVILLWKNPPF